MLLLIELNKNGGQIQQIRKETLSFDVPEYLNFVGNYDGLIREYHILIRRFPPVASRSAASKHKICRSGGKR